MGRRASRELAMKLLYQFEIQKEDREEQIEYSFDEHKVNENDRKYVLDVINGVTENIVSIDELVDKYSKGWKVSRLSKVDLSIIRISIFELLYREDIPLTVSINEAVELAKKFSSEESGSFVNGILGKISKVRLLPSDNPLETEETK